MTDSVTRFRSAAELARNPALTTPPALVASPCAVAGRVTLLTLGPKGGKSTTACAMLAEASRQGVRSGLIQVDEAIPDSLQRLIRFGTNLERVYIAEVYDPTATAEELAAIGADFLVVDHLGKIAALEPDYVPGLAYDPIIWGRIIARFTLLARDQGVAIVLLDQAKRDGKWSGIGEKGGGVDIIAEMEAKDGGLEATPRGRVPLPPFRVELGPDGIPAFSSPGSGSGDRARTEDFGQLRARSRKLLQTLADSEPEGLASSTWWKLAAIPSRTTFNRARRQLLLDGLCLDPSVTKTRRYRVTDKGEASLTTPDVPHVPSSTNGTSGTCTTGTRGYVVPLDRGQTRGTLNHRPLDLIVQDGVAAWSGLVETQQEVRTEMTTQRDTSPGQGDSGG